MDYQNKLHKYKNKIKITNIQRGGKDCDRRQAEDILRSTYIIDTTNFIPFEKSLLHPYRNHPVCSYSIWNKDHTQLYVPTGPSNKDKLYKSQPFYIRLHTVYFKSDDGGREIHMILWSYVHKKWYQVENWPLNDNLLEELFYFLNADGVLSAKMIIDNLYKFRKNFRNQPSKYVENVNQINDLVHSNNLNPSAEVLDELALYTSDSESDVEDFELPSNPKEVADDE